MKRITTLMLSAALFVQPALGWAQAFSGTARLSLQRSYTLDASDKGPARVAFDLLVDTCNGIRAGFYQLPAQQVAADVLARLDQQQVDHYFNQDRAATYITGVLLELPDLQRWNKDSARNPDPQAVAAPNCSAVTQHVHRTATIWREGVVWRLDFTARRAQGARRATDFTARVMPLPKPFESLPTEMIAGAPCREVVAPSVEFFDGHACLWSVFPAVKYLNFPWPLRAETRFGLPQKMLQHDQARLAERNGVLEPGLFDIPPGLTRVGPAP